MNPALYDYLRNQQNPQAQDPIPQESYNPFNSGIRNAIQSARQSLEMTDKQQDKALRRSMLAFAEHMGNEPRQKGFLANFGAAARSLAPALTAYDDEEAAANQENTAFANQLLAHQAHEQQRQAQEEQRDWQRDFAERQLGESVRSHNLLDRFRRDQLEQQNILEGQKNAQEANRQNDKVWQTRATYNTNKLVPELSNQYVRNQEILPTIEELKKLLETSNLAGSSKTAEARRYIAKITGNDEDVLKAKNLGQFYLEWLNNNTKGVLSDKDIAIYSAGFADIEKNPKGGIDILGRLEKKLKGQQEQNLGRLELYNQDPGANLNSLGLLQKAPQAASNQNNSSSLPPTPQVPLDQTSNQEAYVEMMDPATGEKREILLEDVPKGLELGLIEVR